MAGTSWPALVAGARARAADVELKFDWIEGNIVPMSGGSSTDGAYDLGTSAARWRSGYFSTRLNVPALGLSDTTFLSFEATGTLSSAVPIKLPSGVAVNEFSIDGTFGGNSDLAVPTEKATKTYVDSVAGVQSFVKADFNTPITTQTSADFGASTTSGVLLPVKNWREVTDLLGEFDPSTGAFTAATNGTYEVMVRGWASNVNVVAGVYSVTTSDPYLLWSVNSIGVNTVNGSSPLAEDGFYSVGGNVAGTEMSYFTDHQQFSLTSGDTLRLFISGSFVNTSTGGNIRAAYIYGMSATSGTQIPIKTSLFIRRLK